MQSYFYTSKELPFRLAIFWMANRLTDVVAPLLAYGLLRLRGDTPLATQPLSVH